MKQDGIRRETNHKRLLISQNKLRAAGGRRIGREWLVYGHWVGVLAMVSDKKCVSLMIHRLVPLGQIIHYMLIKIINFLKKSNTKQNKTKQNKPCTES